MAGRRPTCRGCGGVLDEPESDYTYVECRECGTRTLVTKGRRREFATHIYNSLCVATSNGSG